ncbi:hypothetical protein DL98DRAFT_536581 [Cadophora sp. DSE1049]|nr:hypothetical protein DL98DRAFT_536581 [Cadophora sp. DSE1049]
MSGPTEDPTIGDDAANRLDATSSRNPDDWVQVYASQLESMPNQFRGTKTENIALKTVSVIPNSFTLFPELPLELRFEIWRDVLYVEEIFTMDWLPLHDSDGFSELRLVHATSKSNLMSVNREARREGKMVLSRFRYTEGEGTWYNPNTDFAWFPDFGYEQFWGDKDCPIAGHIDRIAIPYQDSPFAAHRDSGMVDRYYDSGRLRLRELTLVLGPRDLRSFNGTEIFSSTSEPAYFLLRAGPDRLPTRYPTVEEIARHEMKKMETWKSNIEDERERLKSEGLD